MKRLLGALGLAAILVATVALTPALALADEVTHLCEGDPSCVVDDGGLPGLGPDAPGLPGIPGSFIAVFLLVLIAGVGVSVYRVSAARAMARRAGLDADAAGAVALLDENGLSAAYVASSLQRRSAVPAEQPSRPAAERLAELQALRDSGALTEGEYAARRQAIIDSI